MSKNRIAIVTGGSKGIGRAIAEAMADKGIFVIIADIQKNSSIKHKNISYSKADVSCEKDVKELINSTVDSYGRIDYLINNAAIFNPTPIEKLTLSQWNKTIGTNLTGSFLCSKYASTYLKQTKGSIVNLTSTRAYMSEKNTEAYSASKGGLLSLTHSMAISLGPNVKVNSISPGWIDNREWSTDFFDELSEQDNTQHPAGRVGRPQDIASMILWLIDEKNSFVTGQDFTIDGGMTKKMIYE